MDFDISIATFGELIGDLPSLKLRLIHSVLNARKSKNAMLYLQNFFHAIRKKNSQSFFNCLKHGLDGC